MTIDSVFAIGGKYVLTYQWIPADSGMASLTFEMPTVVSASNANEDLDIDISVRNAKYVPPTDVACEIDNGARHTVSAVSEAGETEALSFLEAMESMRFHATVTKDGQITAFSANGILCDALDEEFGLSGGKARKAALAGRFRSILEALIDYLPPGPLAVGETWQVVRPCVYPPDEYEAYMLTGALSLWEKSMCHIERVDPAKEGEVITVEWKGFRSGPVFPPDYAKAPEYYYDIQGAMHISTPRPTSLQIRTEVTPKRREQSGDDALYGTSVELIELKSSSDS
jgi:hypothetical protein